MDYEKKYEKLVDAVKVLRDNNPSDEGIQNWVNDNVPELKEESEDEKIRKRIYNYINVTLDDNENEEKEKWLTWLEKQGEKKEINLVEILKHYPRGTELYSPLYGKLWLAEVDEEDEIITCYTHQLEQENLVSFYSNGTTGLPDFTISKDCMLFLYNTEKQGGQEEPQVYETEDGEGYKVVEPKFKVDDWIVDNFGSIWKIEGIILNQFYLLEGVGGGESRPTIEWVNKAFHLWTIQDAKDGDVLVDEDNNIGLYRGEKDDFWESYFYLGCDNNLYGFNIGGYHEYKNTKPATKEQREQLFQKIKEAGYEWDAEKKELKIIDWSKHVKYEPIDPSIIEEKPVWTEEDEENLNQLHKIIVKKAYEEYEIDTEDETLWGKHAILDNWLKTLKERLKGGH